MKFKLIIFILGILIIHTNIVSAITGCSVNPDDLWLDANTKLWLTEDYINITCTCSPESTSWSDITDSNNTFVVGFELGNISSTSYNGLTYLPSSLSSGTYNVISYCNSETENDTKTFEIKKLGVKLISQSPSLVYPEDLLTLEVEFELNDEMITYNTDFQIFLGNVLLTMQDAPSPYIIDEYWKINAKVPDSFTSYGDYDFIINATYNTHTVTSVYYDYTKVEPIIKLEIISPSVLSSYKLTDMQDLEIKVKALYKSQTITESDYPDFEVKLNNAILTIKDIYYDAGYWYILANVPKQTPKITPYDLDVYITHKTLKIKNTRPLQVQFLLLLEGKLVDADGDPVNNVEIELKGNNLEEKYITNSSGTYQFGIPPGKYDIKLIFPDMQAEFSDIEISSDESLISDFVQYDYYTEDISDDIEAKKIVVLEFALPFDSVHITIPYSDSNFANEEEIKVFKCSEWNFGKRSCLGAWAEIYGTIDNIRNTISFDMSSLSAFAISEKQDLRLESSLDKDTYYLGENINLNGKVVDKDQKAMSDAEIIYSILSTDISGTITTNKNGEFSTTFNTPNKDGGFEIKIRAKKEPYTPIEKIISFKVQKRRELSIDVLSSVDIKLNQSKQITFTVENIGQTEESNINISVVGISPDWYRLNLESIDELAVNEERTIRLSLAIPYKQCDISHCDSGYTVEIKAKNSEVTSSKTFNLMIEELINKENQENLETNKKGNATISGFLNQTITGFGIVTTSNFTKSFLIIIFAAVVIFFMNKRGAFNKEESRVLITHVLNKIKEEMLKSNTIKKEVYNSKKLKKGKKNFVKHTLINPFKR